ncbi:metal-dependent hydrolase family protein [Natranaerobius thermophilus]|uniref:Amidohydrolase n=1 Tax=Natranaerobius thermophilus (strain ATCC BAA-1301 / DSM 18059 / JW/NM-WN-LF) TaxID=457570 RepID=B2A2V3_NATTJ|nr:amidohydrolase family protein [Natranaerobius thermophilus]ACB86321.1 amidohydrolase [Natranaerobius thermophilus JW/NM-WN-LF]
MKDTTKNIIFENVKLFDGEKIIENATIVIKDGLIADVLDKDEAIQDDQAEFTGQVYNLKGRTLLPGFIDAHTHLDLHGMADTYDENLVEDKLRAIRAAKEMETTLQAGFTTIRNLGSVNGIDISVKAAVEQGIINGPRILTSGKILCITAPGSEYFNGLYEEVNGYDAFKEAAREQLKLGADVLKIMATGAIMNPGGVAGAVQPDVDEIKAVVEEGDKLNKKVASHAHGAEGIKNSIKAGVHTIEHGTFADEEALEMMLQHNIYYVPTLAPDYFMTEYGKEGGVAPFMVEKLKHKKEARIKTLRKAVEMGIKVASGSDAGTPYNFQGNNAREMALMVEYGIMSSQEALKTGTKIAAKACGLEGEVGQIKQGMEADLIVIDGNPVEEINLITDTKNIQLIMKSGKIVKDVLSRS